MSIVNKKKLYLCQFSIIVEKQFVLLPYSVASVWAYAKQDNIVNHNYDLSADIFFIKKPIEQMMSEIKDPDVFALSTYTWNSNYSDTLAKKVKEVYPNCLIVYGGPQVPDNDADLFVKKPWIDICVHQEGEFAFKEILIQNLQDKNWDSIDGISYNIDTKLIRTTKSKRIRNLDEIPSPYMEGIFDGYVEKYSDYTLNAILETNRGCPYKCTFCDWGGVNFSKLVKFDMDRVDKEIDWMGKNKIDCIVNADANFGILKKRDSLIVDKLVETRNLYDYPKLFTTNWAKNNNEVLIDMAKRLKSAGLLRKFAIALQSINKDTLQNIERTNMKVNNFEHLINLASAEDITVMIELIMTLPGETYDTWIENYCKLLKYDNLYIESYPLSVLPNSRMNEPEYREKYGLTTTTVKLPFGDVIDEYEQMVVSTNTMSFEEASRAWIFTWMVRSFHSLGFLHYVANFIVKEYDVSYFEFYKNIEKSIRNSNGIIGQIYKKQQEYIANKEFSKFYLSNWWVTTVGQESRSEFYSEMKNFVKEHYPHHFIDELFDFQNLAHYNPLISYPVVKNFSYNFVDMRDSSCQITLNHQGTGTHKTYKSYISLSRSAVWKCEAKVAHHE